MTGVAATEPSTVPAAADVPQLSDAQVAAAVDLVLRRQADPATPWQDDWGQIVQAAHAAGRLSADRAGAPAACRTWPTCWPKAAAGRPTRRGLVSGTERPRQWATPMGSGMFRQPLRPPRAEPAWERSPWLVYEASST
jgi:hypothetical protein